MSRVPDVARRIAFLVPGHEILARAFGDDDHGVAAAFEAPPQRGQEPLERERDLGHQAEVHLAVDEHRVGGDESRVAAHQLHEADAVARRLGLGVGGVGRPPRLGDRGLEPERLAARTRCRCRWSSARR